ncbi:SusC/RagA family TonB-linked outer membrane protein [Fulvivirgaceae bacterium PWU5]|uniref:SusC/RagA family TonB-linked outer membrane protein n=2 Tax=Dawidia cretensis TaxID=2782350 RepID=A0AAP2GUG5_9BACT|nr:SusC/RagA family TonB-linked outer membrane protein [Dawidia cretensis]
MLTMAALPAFAQTVTGRVTSASDNSALPGVSVMLKGTSWGTATDSDGKFSIELSGGTGTLVVSFIGYASQEISVENRTSIDVVLEEDISQLGEVVITGFGEKKEVARIPYAIQEVKGSDLVRANNGNVINALQGKVAGVQIDQGTGGPMSSSRIRIRGNASLGTNSNPLFVIDGVLIRPTPSGADSWGAAQDNGNIMKNINPDNIESMTVLKGSAASALYGSEALNGVIIITTKKGSTKKGVGITYNHTSSFETAYKYLDVQNEFGGGYQTEFNKGGDGVEQVQDGDFKFYNYGPKLDGRTVRDLDGRMVSWKANDPLSFFETGQYTNHNVVLEGATEKSTARASYSNLRNTTVMPSGTEMLRNNFNIRATHKISEIFDIDVSADYTQNDISNPIRQGGNFNPVFRFVYYRPRQLDIDYWMNNYIDPINGGAKTGAADPYGLSSGFLWDTFQDNVKRTETVFRGNIDLNTHIRPWLTLMVRGNLQDEGYQDERSRLGTGAQFAGGLYNVVTSTTRQYRVQSLLTASKQLGQNFLLNATIGAEVHKTNGGRYYKAFTRASNGANESPSLRVPGEFSLANSSNGIGIETKMNPSRLRNGIYVYGDLTYKEQLTLTYSFRQDYSSTLVYSNGSGDASYYYPAVGMAWTFTETFKNLPSFVTFGKLRANYGKTGGDTDAWTINETGSYMIRPEYIGPNGTVNYADFRDNVLANANLKNKEASEIEIGADLRFLQNRIGLDIAYYDKRSKNEIFNLKASPESGVSDRVVNGGEIQNKGIELILRGTPVKTSDWEWNTSINFTRNRNNIISLPDGVASQQLSLAFGNDVYSMAKPGRQYGVIATPYAYATYQAKDGEGNPIASPSNGKKVLGVASNGSTGYTFLRSGSYGQGDKELGTSMEKYLWSNINTVSYKNFTLNVQVDAKIGGLMASATHQYGTSNGSLSNSLFGRDLDHGGVEYVDADGITRYDGIIPDGVMADGIKADNDPNIDLGGMSYAEAVENGYLKPVPAIYYYENLTQWSSGIREYSVFENSWVSLREISLGYNVPASFASKLKMQTLRLNLTARNVAYLYRTAKSDINPEGLKSSNAGEFAEFGGMPFTRQWGVSVTAGF